MEVCIVGGGGRASNTANVIRSLDKQAQIDIFINRDEIGNLPCEIPFVLKGALPSWESSFVFRDKFYKERNIEVHPNTEVTQINREKKRLIVGEQSYSYDKVILDLGAIPEIPHIQGLGGWDEYRLSSGLSPDRDFEEAIPKYQSATVICVGQIALEISVILSAKSYRKIYLVGRSNRILRAYLDKDMAEIVEGKIRENGIELILSTELARIATQGRLAICGKDKA